MMQTVVPGLENDFQKLREVVSGGSPALWMEYKKVKLYTNAFVFHDNKVRSFNTQLRLDTTNCSPGIYVDLTWLQETGYWDAQVS